MLSFMRPWAARRAATGRRAESGGSVHTIETAAAFTRFLSRIAREVQERQRARLAGAGEREGRPGPPGAFPAVRDAG